MADEIAITIKATLANGLSKDEFNPGQVRITQANEGTDGGIVAVSDSADTLIELSRISSNEGYVLLRNLDDTNYVDVGPADEYGEIVVSVLRLKAGEPQAFRLVPGVQLAARADTASVNLQVKAWRN